MKKAILASAAIMLSLSVAAPAFAAATTTSGSTTPSASTTHSKPGVHAAKAHYKTMQGTVKAVSGSSLTLTVHSTDYMVNAASSARIKNRKWHTITLTDIQVGDKVRVYGSVSGTVVTARIIRDISLPMASSSANH